MNILDEHWEAQINALLDGELGAEETAELRREAEHNAALARAIVDAYALQSSLDALQLERAPDSLRARLADIPQAEKARTSAEPRLSWFGMPRWVAAGAMAAVPLAVVAMLMMQAPETGPAPEQPQFTQEQIEQAARDVQTAFAYLDRIGERTGLEIQGQLAKELSHGVNDNVAEHMPFTSRNKREENS